MVCNLKILSEIGYKNNKNLDHVYIYIYIWKWLSLRKMEETKERIISRNLLGMI